MNCIGCVVQGDLRVAVEPVLREMKQHCDVLILSTWEDQRSRVPAGRWFDTVYSKPPAVRGITNRNLQRMSTAAGLRLAAERGCTHILKWRTDLLPTRLDRAQLLAWSTERPVENQGGRIVMSAFRNLSVTPDWFSSFPDLFAFGKTPLMRLLWDDEGFDYGQAYNLPAGMVSDCGWTNREGDRASIGGGPTHDIAALYDAHVEFYALFKSRLERTTGRTWTHGEIVRRVLRPIDHRWLGICWLKSGGRLPYRSMVQASHVPWWTANDWHDGRQATPVELEELMRRSPRWTDRIRNHAGIYGELLQQIYWHRESGLERWLGT